MRRKVFWIAAILALIGGFYAFSKRSSRERQVIYETAEVTRGPLIARITASGTLSPTVTVQVGTQVTGRIQQLFADFNSQVRKGQVIARLDPQVFEATVAQMRANHKAAMANLTKARVQAEEAQRQYERVKRLAASKYISDAEVDTAESNMHVARAQVEVAKAALYQAKAALEQAEVNLAYTTIVSPIDGIVISRNVDVGQTVAATLQAPVLFTIAEDLKKMQVHCNVAEADVGRIRAGMEVTFTVDAWPSERFNGIVREVRNSPQTVQNVVTYDAVIDVENPELKLKPGMTANVTFVVAERQDALLVPNAALRFRPPPDMAKALPSEAKGKATLDRRIVWVLREGIAKPVVLRVGITDGAMTEVIEGDLREKDLVVIDLAGDARPDKAAGFRRPF